ncbi:uncharacterized protein TRIVIDRAFT_63653 [Trichoderma virens Gv29-8]|uniref:AA1-like domain-containing protein n=1 Tax=Hypocrea virens (strain Gv29-8 / FGSC 10586) TaxID=413071 RepID=G9MI01_HYPVG|nr:uncharacterized protein TRIVIDRAFT_63653 [Trichoderma virens Gv29-8]EHK26336.1 hypothetical protein TRIVIDRAFT_63653 [Trichoderma virens Gv29-8]
MSALSYSPPPELLAQAQSQSDCNLPPGFQIKNFAAKSNETGPAATLTAYNFTFVDQTTSVTTNCHYNSSSVSTTPPGLTPRYACEKSDIKFIWDNAQRQLTITERICPKANGAATWEVAGSAIIPLSCSTPPGACTTNSTDIDGKFTALDPVTDPTLAKYWVS